MKKVRLLLHSLGISCLCSAVFLHALVISTFLRGKRFIGYEENSVVLAIEAFFAVYAIVYWLYLIVTRIKVEMKVE